MKKIIIFLQVIAICFLISINHGFGQWEQIGPIGGRIWDIAVSENGNIIASVNNGIYLSTNDGIKWFRSYNAANSSDYYCFIKNDKKVFAFGSGLLLSTDDGLNWETRDVGIEDLWIQSLAFYQNNILALTGIGLYISSNDGKKWIKINDDLVREAVRNLIMIDSIMFIGTARSGYYQSIDFGLNWVKMEISGYAILDMYNEFENLYAKTKNGLHLSSDRGSSWININCPNQMISCSILFVHNSIIYIDTDEGLFISSDLGNKWENIGLNDENIFCIAIKDSVLFAGTEKHGIFSKMGLLSEWIPSNTNIYGSSISSILTIGDTIFTTADGELYKSTNNGYLWRNINKNFPSNHIEDIIFHKGVMYITTESDGIFKSEDFGETYEQIGLKDIGINTIDVNDSGIYIGTNYDGVYYKAHADSLWELIGDTKKNYDVMNILFLNKIIFISTQEGLFKSLDKGVNWTFCGINEDWIGSIKQIGDVLYIGMFFKGIYRSYDFGDSWQAVNEGLTSLKIYTMLIKDSMIYVGTSDKGIFFKSKNQSYWINCKHEFPNNEVRVMSINDDYIFVGSDHSISRAKISDLITSVEEKPLTNSSFLLYPNPAQEYLEISNLKEESNFQIFSIEGILQLEGRTFGRVDVSELAFGMYYIRIGDEVLRFVKL
jgi:photosystem II stability/assembly factor-like uncharacterized protein